MQKLILAFAPIYINHADLAGLIKLLIELVTCTVARVSLVGNRRSTNPPRRRAYSLRQGPVRLIGRSGDRASPRTLRGDRRINRSRRDYGTEEEGYTRAMIIAGVRPKESGEGRVNGPQKPGKISDASVGGRLKCPLKLLLVSQRGTARGDSAPSRGGARPHLGRHGDGFRVLFLGQSTPTIHG